VFNPVWCRRTDDVKTIAECGTDLGGRVKVIRILEIFSSLLCLSFKVLLRIYFTVAKNNRRFSFRHISGKVFSRTAVPEDIGFCCAGAVQGLAALQSVTEPRLSSASRSRVFCGFNINVAQLISVRSVASQRAGCFSMKCSFSIDAERECVARNFPRHVQ
jgi:hypothetical protein